MFLSQPIDQVRHLLFEEGEARQNHVLPSDAPVCKFINSADEVDILCGHRVNTSCRVHTERPRLRTLHILNVQLEHGCEFRPEGHADTVMVEVEYWDLVSLLHQLLVLLVELDAEEDCIDIDAPARAGSS